MDRLEERVVMNADPVAYHWTDSIRVRSDGPTMVSSAYYASLAGGYDPDGGDVTIIAEDELPAEIALEGGQEYLWSYTIQDDEGATAVGTVTLHGLANQAPVAEDFEHTIVIPYGQTTIDVNLAEFFPTVTSDADGDEPTVWGFPTETVTLEVGTHEFEYTIDDGWGAADTGVVRITIVVDEPINNGPTAIDDSHVEVIGHNDEYAWIDWASLLTTYALANDWDPDQDPLELVEFSNPSWEIVYPDESRTCYYTVRDPSGATAGAAFTIYVERPNEGPIAVDDSHVEVIGHNDEYAWIDWASLLTTYALANDWDPDQDPLELVDFTGPTWEMVLPGESRTIYYTVQDPSGATATTTFTLYVERPNEAPIAVDDSHVEMIGHNDEYASIDWASLLTTYALANDWDPDQDPLELVDFSNPAWEIIYVGESRTCYYTVRDPSGATATASFTLYVERPNEAPAADDDTHTEVIGHDDEYAWIDWASLLATYALANDSDPDQDPLEIVSFSSPSWEAVYPGETRTCYYTVQDPGGATATAAFTLTVERPNEAPLPQDDAYETASGTAFLVEASGVLGNDGDPDGDMLAVVDYTQGQHGTVTMNADGSFSYTASTEFWGTDQFTYTVDDGHGGLGTATVSIVVNRNVEAHDDSYSAIWNRPLEVGAASSVVANDVDPATMSLVVGAYTGRTEHGSLVLNADGSFIYTPDAGYVGDDYFDYTITNEYGHNASARVTVTVHPIEVTVAATSDYVIVNNDDDDGNDVEDRLQTNVSGEDNLVAAVLTVNNPGDADLAGYKLRITFGPQIRVWTTADKQQAIESGTEFAIGAGDPMNYLPGVVYIEGYADGQATLQAELLRPDATIEDSDACQVTAEEFSIERNGEAAPGVDTPGTLYLGERNELHLAGDGEVANIVWTIEGRDETVKSYTQGSATTVERLQDADLTSRDVTFYWYTPKNDGRKVSVTFTAANGQTHTVSAKWKSIEPTGNDGNRLEISATLEQCYVYENSSGDTVMSLGVNNGVDDFGNDLMNRPGMIAQVTTPISETLRSKLYWVQLTTLSVDAYNAETQTTIDFMEYGVDAGFPQSVGASTNDAPNLILTDLSGTVAFHASYTTILMYQHDLNSIPVPIRYFDWRIRIDLEKSGGEWDRRYADDPNTPVFDPNGVVEVKMTQPPADARILPEWEQVVNLG